MKWTQPNFLNVHFRASGPKYSPTSRCAKCGIGYSFSLKVKWGYISAQKPESEPKSFAVFFDWKTRSSRVSLASLGLENIPQVPANRAEVCQNHGALKAVSATPSVLKWSGALFRPTSSKLKAQKKITVSISLQTKKGECWKSFALSISMQTKAHQEIVYSLRDIKISPKFREIEPKFVKITMRVRRSRLLLKS